MESGVDEDEWQHGSRLRTRRAGWPPWGRACVGGRRLVRDNCGQRAGVAYETTRVQWCAGARPGGCCGGVGSTTARVRAEARARCGYAASGSGGDGSAPGMCIAGVSSKVEHAARGPKAWPGARDFGAARARHGPTPQAVPRPLPQPGGRHGTARKNAAGP
jgi:hypothetical protein